MIRFCRGLISQDCTRYYYSVCLLTKTKCITLQPSNVSALGANLCFFNHLASLAATPTVNKNAEVSEVSKSSKTISIIETMQQFGFKENEVKTILKNEPDLWKTSPILWSNIVGLLLEFGFEKYSILCILERWPKVIYMNKNDLVKNLEAWNNCGLGEKLTSLILTTHPYFLQVDSKLVSKRIKQYQLHFENKRRVGKMLLLAPNTLEEKWSILQEKLNFLDELCTEKSDLVSTGALAHSVFHIKARHEFLIRAGIYKRPQKDFHKRLSKNPKLSNIVNTSDKHFVYKAGLSIFEYKVFLDMFRGELEDSDDNDSDTDDDERKLSYNKHHRRNK